MLKYFVLTLSMTLRATLLRGASLLLDILMPDMDGMTMMKKLLENDWGKKVKIIVLTNLQADEAIVRGITRDEPTYYFVKADWQISAVLEKVKVL